MLGDSEAVEQLAEAHRAYVEGDSVRGVEAVRALRQEAKERRGSSLTHRLTRPLVAR